MEAEPNEGLALAEHLADACATVLGDAVVSIVVHGSIALGDYRPGKSDLDLLIVVERPLSDDEIAALETAALSFAASTATRVDVRVVTADVAAAPPRTPPLEAYVGVHGDSQVELAARVPHEPDLVVEFAMARDHGRALRGSDPRVVIGPVPAEWLVILGDSVVARWQELTDDDAHAELMVLTTCRIWRHAVEGVLCSKLDAGKWACSRDPSLAAVVHALRRRNDGVAPIAAEDIAVLLSRARAEMAAVAQLLRP